MDFASALLPAAASSGGDAVADERAVFQIYIFSCLQSFVSRRPTGVALWLLVGATNIEAGTVQSQDQHLEQLQSRCSSIVLTREVKGHCCLCSCSSERRAAWMSVKRLCICTNLRGTCPCVDAVIRAHTHTCSHTLSTLFSPTFVLIF